MSVQSVLHSTNMANVSVTLESDLAGLPVRNYPDGTTSFARDSQKLFVWNSQSAAGTVAGVSVAVATGGAWLVIQNGASGSGTLAETRFVAKNGNDATGDGSFDSPFLTIQAAITSITDATSAKPYVVKVAAGVYTTAFVLTPWIFIVGFGRKSTVIQNASGNWIGATFAGATQFDTGIFNCILQTNTLTVDFNAVASTAGRFFFHDSIIDGIGWTITGSANTNLFSSQNIQQLSSAVLNATITNCPSIQGNIELFNTNLNITNTATFLMSARIGGITGNRAITLTCNDTTNLLSVSCTYFSTISTYIVVVGSGVTILGRGLVFHSALADANATINFTTPLVAGAIVAANEGDNLLSMGPTVDRTLTLGEANPTTRLRIVNTSTTSNILLTGTAVAGGQQTYIPPNGYLEIWRDAGVWRTMISIQKGSVTLVNGVSALITADILATAKITATLSTWNGATGLPDCKTVDRVLGAKATGGGFKITSIDPATGLTVATDNGTYDWLVQN